MDSSVLDSVYISTIKTANHGISAEKFYDVTLKAMPHDLNIGLRIIHVSLLILVTMTKAFKIAL